MYGALDISVSGMVAQRVRLTTIAANIASSHAVLNSKGEAEAFRRKFTILAPGDPTAAAPQGQALGVHVAAIEESTAPPRAKYAPNHPLADAQGYIYLPDIDPVSEQIDAMEALRAYEANVAAAEAAKTMIAQALRMIA